MLTTSDLAKDGGALALLSSPLAFVQNVDTAVLVTVVNIVVVAALRVYEINRRSAERLEMARLRVAAGQSPDEPAGATPVGLLARLRPAPKHDHKKDPE